MTEDSIISNDKSFWKNRTRHTDGYIWIRIPNHPRAKWGYVFEHILVMETYLGRYLREGEVVHHRNKKRDDNRIENLQLFTSNGEHMAMENKKDLSNRICCDCGSNTTLKDKKRDRHFWYRTPDNRWRCNKCFSRFYNKIIRNRTANAR